MRDYPTPIVLSLLIVLLPLHATATQPHGELLREPMPMQWVHDEHFNQELPTDDHWWSSFDDPLLDSLIAEGVKNNFDVEAAIHRIEIAHQQLNSIRSGYYPTVNATGGWTRQRTSSIAIHSGATDYTSIGLNASWEVDIFGKITAKARQQRATYNATRAEYAATMTALCANIAKNYVTLRMYQAENTVATQHIASQGEIVKITRARHNAGLASALDVAQAQIVYYSTQASLPGLETSIHTTINALATLVGVYPEQLRAVLTVERQMPDYRRIVAVGIPADLLRRRPDIVQAEYEVAAYAAAIGIAKRDFLPTLTINGTIGSSARDSEDLFTRNSLTYTVAPTLTWTLFDGLSRRANMVAARRQYAAGVDNYNLTVMTAVSEVDNAYSSYLGSLRSIATLQRVVEESRTALNLSLDLYKSDLKPFSDVVSAQLSLLEYQNSLVAQKGQALTALVALYEALGGGWDGNTTN